MKKRLITLAVGLIVAAGSVSAEVLERWTYDDAAGKAIHECVNNGSVGTTWAWGDVAKWATDGLGNLDVAPTGGADYKTSNDFPAALDTNQTYTLEIKIAEWDIPAAAPDSTAKFRLRSAASSTPVLGIQTVMTTNGLSFTLISDGTNYRNHPVGGLTGSNATAKIVFNPAAGTATYYVNGAEKNSFSGLTLDPLEKFQMNKEGDWTTAGKVLKIDEQSLSNADAPEGVYVFDKYVSTENNSAITETVKTFNVEVGDVIAIVSASSSKDEPAEASISFPGATATLDPVVSARANEYKGCSTRYWYTTATTSGTVPVEVQRNGTAYWITGAYQLRSGDGYTAPTLIGSPVAGGFDGVQSLTNNYTLGTNYAGVYIESLSSYSQGWEPDTASTVINGAGYKNQRMIGAGQFSGVASLDSIWSMTNAAGQATSVGLAFASLPDGIVATPQEQYDAWLAGFSVDPADAGMTVDADGDLLDNLTEYTFGGAPDNPADQGNTPVQSMVNDGGTDYLEYIYYELDDATSRGLASVCEVGTGLVMTNWADASGYETGRGASGAAGFDAITNRIPTDVESKQFIRLQIEFTP